MVCEPNVPEGLGLSDLKSKRTRFRLTPDAERHKTDVREPPKEPNRAMKSSLSRDVAEPAAAPGRPPEIEVPINRSTTRCDTGWTRWRLVASSISCGRPGAKVGAAESQERLDFMAAFGSLGDLRMAVL